MGFFQYCRKVWWKFSIISLETVACFWNYTGKLAENVTAQDEAFAVECIGTLANLNLPTIDYSLVLAEYDLLKWLKSTLAPDSPAKDDIVLESVLLGEARNKKIGNLW